MTDDIVARLRKERDALHAGLSAIIHCQSALRRSEMREAAAGLLDKVGLKPMWFDGDQSPFVRRALAAEARVRELEAWRDKAIVVLKWTDEVYPARIEAGGAGVEITWDEFNAMREVAGFKPVKRINDKEGRAGFNHRLRARLSTIEAETIERCAQAVHGAVQMIPMGQVDASEFLDVIEDAIAAAIRKLAQEVKS